MILLPLSTMTACSSMEVIRNHPLRRLPRLIQSLQHIFRQRTFLQILQILPQMLLTTRPNNNLITPLFLQHRMMRHPPQRALRLSQPMFPRSFPNDIQRIEHRIVEVPFPIRLPLHRRLIEPRRGLDFLLDGLPVVARSEIPACNGVEGVEAHVVVSETGE
jgi:hypothetical protein